MKGFASTKMGRKYTIQRIAHSYNYVAATLVPVTNNLLNWS